MVQAGLARRPASVSPARWTRICARRRPLRPSPPPIQLPRSPAFSHGFVSLLWGVSLGAYVWAGLLAIGVSQVTSVIFGIVAVVVIFFYVRLYGDDPLRRRS